MSLSKLLIPQDDSVSLPYLVNYAEQNPVEFIGIHPTEVQKLCVRARNRLSEFEALQRDIKFLRDGELAHLDKHRLTEPDFAIPDSIQLETLSKIVSDINQLLNEFGVLYSQHQLELLDTYKVVRDELRNMLA